MWAEKELSHPTVIILIFLVVVAYGTEPGIVPCLVPWAFLTWGERWACLVLSIACRLVEDLALDVSRSWGTYPAYGSLVLRVH